MLDLSNVKSQKPQLLPDGKYNCAVTKAEMTDTKNRTGMMVKIELRVMEGEFEGRKVFHNFNVQNNNPKAQEIGQAQLKSLMEAAGWKEFVLKSTQDLEGIKVGVKTKTRHDEDYGDRAEVSYFFPVVVVSKDEKLPF